MPNTVESLKHNKRQIHTEIEIEIENTQSEKELFNMQQQQQQHTNLFYVQCATFPIVLCTRSRCARLWAFVFINTCKFAIHWQMPDKIEIFCMHNEMHAHARRMRKQANVVSFGFIFRDLQCSFWLFFHRLLVHFSLDLILSLSLSLYLPTSLKYAALCAIFHSCSLPLSPGLFNKVHLFASEIHLLHVDNG